MDRAPTTILVVEDYQPCRALIISLLNENPDLQVVGEACDGLAAVAEAQELRPDVILMDIGLPRLNGLDAARRIRELLPASKVVFLTVETDADLIQGAFNLGASAYIAKAKAATELLATLNRICPPGNPPSGCTTAQSGQERTTTIARI